MFRRALGLICVIVLTACSPELIPVPITPIATQPPATSMPLTLSAPTVAAPHLISISMIDEKNGWGVNDTAVLRTIDGGTTWYNVGPTGASALGYAVDSDFLDVNRGWVLAPDPKDMLQGTLYRTTDGGRTWTNFAVPFGGGDLHFLDSSHGWMMASLGAGAGSMGVGIFQSTDGGATWSQTYTNDPNQSGAGTSLPLGGLKDGLTPINMQTAWVGGITYTPGVIYLYSSGDGGHTWAQSPVKIPDGYDQAQFETTGPVFASPDIAYLPVHISSQNGVMLAVYVSRDGGGSWLPSSTLIPMGASISVISDKVVIAWNGTNFYVSTDQAQTWSTVAPDVSFSDTFAGMDFVSARVGYVLTNDASGNFGLYLTTDGGSSWNILAR